MRSARVLRGPPSPSASPPAAPGGPTEGAGRDATALDASHSCKGKVEMQVQMQVQINWGSWDQGMPQQGAV